MTPTLSIEIWSDIVCPFCYIGKMKLEQTLRKLNALDKVEITWRSFQLDPTFPKNTSKNSAIHLSEKTGIPMERLSNMFVELKPNRTTLRNRFEIRPNTCFQYLRPSPFMAMEQNRKQRTTI